MPYDPNTIAQAQKEAKTEKLWVFGYGGLTVISSLFWARATIWVDKAAASGSTTLYRFSNGRLLPLIGMFFGLIMFLERLGNNDDLKNKRKEILRDAAVSERLKTDPSFQGLFKTDLTAKGRLKILAERYNSRAEAEKNGVYTKYFFEKVRSIYYEELSKTEDEQKIRGHLNFSELYAIFCETISVPSIHTREGLLVSAPSPNEGKVETIFASFQNWIKYKLEN